MPDKKSVNVPLEQWQKMKSRLAEFEKTQFSKEHTENKLLQERNLLRTLIDNLPDCIFIKDRRGRIVTVNEAAAKSVGKDSPDEVIGKTDYYFHPSEMAKIYELDESKVFEMGESIINKEYLLYYACDPKKPRWYNVTKVPLRGPDDEVVGIVGIGRDITSRKRMQQEILEANDLLEKRVRDRTKELSRSNKLLKEQIAERKKYEEQLSREHSLLRTLIDNVPDLIYFKDVEGRFMISNDAFTSFLGKKTEQQVIDKTHFDFLSADMAKKLKLKEQAVIESGQGAENQEEVIIDNTTKQNNWFSTTRIPVHDSKGKSFGLVCITRDITKRRLAEENLHQFHEEMIHAERLSSLGTVSAVMAHELNQPLTIIHLFLQQSLRSLKQTSCTQKVMRKIEDCLVEISNSIEIIRRFRDFTRIPEESIVKDIKLNDIVERVVAVLSFNATKSNINVNVNVRNISGITGDLSDIEQLFFIFIENAIQAADGKKARQLNVTASARKDKLFLEFKDDCHGIDSNNLKKIFEPFFTTKSVGVGTGLGLLIAKDIISKYGGKIDVKSELGKGSIFTITLPRKMTVLLGSKK